VEHSADFVILPSLAARQFIRRKPFKIHFCCEKSEL
jgi:hypothetical protein